MQVAKESELPFSLSPQNPINSPNNSNNSINNSSNSASNSSNSSSNSENSPSKTENGMTGNRRLLFEKDGSYFFIGYFVYGENSLINFFSPYGKRMFYAPSESYALFGAENGEFCGTLATVNDKTVLMLTEKGQLALKKEGISPFSQSDIQKSSTGMYYDVGRDHQIRENSNSGSTIVLEDGSIWEIGSMDQMIAMSWRVSTSITVSSTGSGSYGYVLINNDYEKTVHANFIGKK